MTGTAVTELCGAISNMQSIPGVGQTQAKGFADAFEVAAGKTSETENSGVNGRNSSKTDVFGKTSFTGTANNSNRKINTSDSKKKLEEKAAELVSMVTGEINSYSENKVTEEEVAAITEDGASLLTMDGIKEALGTLLGIEDPMDMVTDADLCDLFLEIENNAESLLVELKEELGISDAELEDLLNGMYSTDVNDEISVEEIFDFKAEGIKEDGKPDAQALAENSFTEEIAEEVSDKEIKTGDKDNDSDTPDNTMNFAQNTYETQIENHEVFTEAVSNTADVSTQDIINQITDYIRNKSTDDLKEVELQLHPESLGNVNVTVASKAGNVTAQIIAQNETVKAALESQMIQLKESFEEHGITVEAIEVTVENRKFDQSMNDGRDDANREAERKSNSTRRIRFDGISDLSDVDEEDRVEAEMMVANGNSLDYKA